MRNLLQLLLTLLILSALGWVAWQGFVLFASEGQRLPPGQRAWLVVGGVLLLSCSLIVSRAIRGRAGDRVQARLLQRRGELYEAFLVLWNRTHTEAVERNVSRIELDASEVTAGMTLYGSEGVVDAVHVLLTVLEEEGISHTDAPFEIMLNAMRNDLGNTNYYSVDTQYNRLFSNSTKTTKP